MSSMAEAPTHRRVHVLSSKCQSLQAAIVKLITLNRYSVLPALSLDGIFECLIVEGSFNMTLFLEFIKVTLWKMNPFPMSIDNCHIHKHLEITRTIEGMKVDFFATLFPSSEPNWTSIFSHQVTFVKSQQHCLMGMAFNAARWQWCVQASLWFCLYYRKEGSIRFLSP